MEIDFVSVMKVEETRIGGVLSNEIDECVCSNCSICCAYENVRKEIAKAVKTIDSLHTKKKEWKDKIEEKNRDIEKSLQNLKDVTKTNKQLYVQYFSLEEENENLQKQLNELAELLKKKERNVNKVTRQLNKIRADFSIVNQEFLEKYLSKPEIPRKNIASKRISNQSLRRLRLKASRKDPCYPSTQISLKSASKYNNSINKQDHTNNEKSRWKLSTSNSFILSQRHNKTKQPSSQSDKLQCTVCMKRFSSILSLISHQRIHSPKKISDIRCEMVLNTETPQLPSQAKELQCPVCSKICLSAAGLVHHKRSHMGKQKNREAKSSISQTNKLQCPICSKVCRNSTGLAHHRRSHDRELKINIVRDGSDLSPVKPHQVTQELKNKISLQSKIDDTNFNCWQHTEEIQQDQRNSAGNKNEKCYQCRKCNKSFYYAAQLHEHENIHTGKKPFSCEICSKSFTYRASAYNHSLTHGIFRAFQCPKCKYSFTRLAHLRRHMLVHQRNSSHKCGLCGASFARPSLLKIHNKKIHSQQLRPVV